MIVQEKHALVNNILHGTNLLYTYWYEYFTSSQATRKTRSLKINPLPSWKHQPHPSTYRTSSSFSACHLFIYSQMLFQYINFKIPNNVGKIQFTRDQSNHPAITISYFDEIFAITHHYDVGLNDRNGTLHILLGIWKPWIGSVWLPDFRYICDLLMSAINDIQWFYWSSERLFFLCSSFFLL